MGRRNSHQARGKVPFHRIVEVVELYASHLHFSRAKGPSADASHANKSHELRSMLVATQNMPHKSGSRATFEPPSSN